jgi:peptidoglycan/LPS O-acetylase OafA/YrhL
MRKRGTVLLALILIILGSYLLLSELNAELPGWRQVWPVFPFAAGLALIIAYIVNPQDNPDHVFLGTAATLVGVVFFFVTLGPLEYRDLESWWPVFVLIGGAAFLAQWAAGGFQNWDSLFLGLVALIVGSGAFTITFQLLGPGTREILPKLWPVVLILVGLMVLLRRVLGRRPR